MTYSYHNKKEELAAQKMRSNRIVFAKLEDLKSRDTVPYSSLSLF